MIDAVERGARMAERATAWGAAQAAVLRGDAEAMRRARATWLRLSRPELTAAWRVFMGAMLAHGDDDTAYDAAYSAAYDAAVEAGVKLGLEQDDAHRVAAEVANIDSDRRRAWAGQYTDSQGLLQQA